MASILCPGTPRSLPVDCSNGVKDDANFQQRLDICAADNWLYQFIEERWPQHMDTIRLHPEVTLEELLAFGRLDQASGINAFKIQFRMPVLHDEMALAMWEHAVAVKAHKNEHIPAINTDGSNPLTRNEDPLRPGHDEPEGITGERRPSWWNWATSTIFNSSISSLRRGSKISSSGDCLDVLESCDSSTRCCGGNCCQDTDAGKESQSDRKPHVKRQHKPARSLASRRGSNTSLNSTARSVDNGVKETLDAANSIECFCGTRTRVPDELLCSTPKSPQRRRGAFGRTWDAWIAKLDLSAFKEQKPALETSNSTNRPGLMSSGDSWYWDGNCGRVRCSRRDCEAIVRFPLPFAGTSDTADDQVRDSVG